MSNFEIKLRGKKLQTLFTAESHAGFQVWKWGLLICVLLLKQPVKKKKGFSTPEPSICIQDLMITVKQGHRSLKNSNNNHMPLKIH